MESWWCSLSALLAFGLILQLDAVLGCNGCADAVGNHPGQCPKFVLAAYFKPCPDKCSNDYDCGYNEKCCYQGCGRMCVAITPTNPRVKPGQCPTYVPSRYYEYCPDKCSNDYDCGYNEKCCYQGCGRTCVAITPTYPRLNSGECPTYVPSSYYGSCPDKCSNDYDCGYNEKCCYQGCGRTCVAITPTYQVIPGVKPGVCPTYVQSPYYKSCPDKCSNDYDCGYNEKCCYQGCGRTCVAITPTYQGVKPGVCPTYVQSPYYKSCPDTCSNDYDCGYNEKCCYRGCGRTCVAITSVNNGVKHGVCPQYVRSPYYKYCPDKCSNDYDCGYNEKCCYQGCGRTCVTITPTYPRMKSGECPKYVQSSYLYTHTRCADKCSNDYNCGYNEKCCYQGCGRRCVAIRPINPRLNSGECPQYVRSSYYHSCPDKCSNDYDCGYNEKCCYHGCGRTCVAITPILSEKPGVCPIQHYSLKSHGTYCVNRCSDDYSCPGNKKCCKFGCGQACLTPTSDHFWRTG